MFVHRLRSSYLFNFCNGAHELDSSAKFLTFCSKPFFYFFLCDKLKSCDNSCFYKTKPILSCKATRFHGRCHFVFVKVAVTWKPQYCYFQFENVGQTWEILIKSVVNGVWRICVWVTVLKWNVREIKRS